MTTQLNFGRDVQGFNAYAPEQADIKYSALLTNGDDDTITIPETNEKWIMGITQTPGTSIWVSVNGTASAPIAPTFSSSTAELNPPARTVYAGDEINILCTSSTAEIGVVLYAIP